METPFFEQRQKRSGSALAKCVSITVLFFLLIHCCTAQKKIGFWRGWSYALLPFITPRRSFLKPFSILRTRFAVASSEYCKLNWSESDDRETPVCSSAYWNRFNRVLAILWACNLVLPVSVKALTGFRRLTVASIANAREERCFIIQNPNGGQSYTVMAYDDILLNENFPIVFMK